MRNHICTLFAFVLLTTMTIGCCGGDSDQPYNGKINNVVKVFMHQSSHYSVMYEDKEILRTWDFGNWAPVLIKKDVEKDAPMWVEYQGTKSEKYNSIKYKRITIHVRSADDINGAGWNRGKGGRGQTNVVAP